MTVDLALTISARSFCLLAQVVDVPARKYLIMQYSSGGDLCRYVREKRRLIDHEACRLFCQIVRGLQVRAHSRLTPQASAHHLSLGLL
jgi:hypothetical protein